MTSVDSEISKPRNMEISEVMANNVKINRQTIHLSLLSTILYVRDHLYMRRDNLAHFLPLNGNITSEVTFDLLRRNRFSL